MSRPPQNSSERPKIEVETPFLFSGSNLQEWLRRDMGENAFDLSVISNELPYLLKQLTREEEEVARHLENEYRRALEYLAERYISAASTLQREFEARSDPNEKKEIREIQERLQHRINDLHHLSPQRLSSEFENFGRLLVGPQLEPTFIHAIKHGMQVLNIVLKTPIASAILGATAKQLVDSVAKWVKAQRKDETVEIRLFGPDGQLIDRRRVD